MTIRKTAHRLRFVALCLLTLGLVLTSAMVRADNEDNCQPLRDDGWTCYPFKDCQEMTWCVAGSTSCFPFFQVEYKHRKPKSQSICYKDENEVLSTACGADSNAGCCSGATSEPACDANCF